VRRWGFAGDFATLEPNIPVVIGYSKFYNQILNMFYLFAGWIATSVGRDHKKLLPNSWQIFDSKKGSSFAESIFKIDGLLKRYRPFGPPQLYKLVKKKNDYF